MSAAFNNEQVAMVCAVIGLSAQVRRVGDVTVPQLYSDDEVLAEARRIKGLLFSLYDDERAEMLASMSDFLEPAPTLFARLRKGRK